jgi:hypothetical protein
MPSRGGETHRCKTDSESRLFGHKDTVIVNRQHYGVASLSYTIGSCMRPSSHRSQWLQSLTDIVTGTRIKAPVITGFC